MITQNSHSAMIAKTSGSTMFPDNNHHVKDDNDHHVKDDQNIRHNQKAYQKQ